jgi:hypothetical protein
MINFLWIRSDSPTMSWKMSDLKVLVPFWRLVIGCDLEVVEDSDGNVFEREIKNICDCVLISNERTIT